MVNEFEYGMIRIDTCLVVVTETTQLVFPFEPTNLYDMRLSAEMLRSWMFYTAILL